MPIGLSREEVTKALMFTEAEILKELQFATKGKATATTTEQISAVMSLLIGKTTEVILANNQRMAEQLTAAGIMLESNR